MSPVYLGDILGICPQEGLYGADPMREMPVYCVQSNMICTIEHFFLSILYKTIFTNHDCMPYYI